MKCCEVTRCGDKERKNCYVWRHFQNDMENIKCWVICGAYHQDNRDQLKRCLKCPYYKAMNGRGTELAAGDAAVGLVTCRGILNNDRSKVLSEIWTRLKAAGKNSVVVDLSAVTNVYSCGLGAIVKIHKEAEEKGGTAVFTGVQGYPQAIFESTRLTRLVHQSRDQRSALEFIESRRPKAPVPDSGQSPQAAVEKTVRERPACWEYWNNHNPRNAGSCDECYRKISPTPGPCWMVEGVIEGTTFQYVNEDCLACGYFLEFGTGPAIT